MPLRYLWMGRLALAAGRFFVISREPFGIGTAPVDAVSNRNFFGPELQVLGPAGLGARGGVLFPVGHAAGRAMSLGISFGF
jgi:hypothetical protein